MRILLFPLFVLLFVNNFLVSIQFLGRSGIYAVIVGDLSRRGNFVGIFLFFRASSHQFPYLYKLTRFLPSINRRVSFCAQVYWVFDDVLKIMKEIDFFMSLDFFTTGSLVAVRSHSWLFQQAFHLCQASNQRIQGLSLTVCVVVLLKRLFSFRFFVFWRLFFSFKFFIKYPDTWKYELYFSYSRFYHFQRKDLTHECTLTCITCP